MDAQNSGKSVVKTTIGYNDPSSTTATGQVRTWKSGATTYTNLFDASKMHAGQRINSGGQLEANSAWNVSNDISYEAGSTSTVRIKGIGSPTASDGRVCYSTDNGASWYAAVYMKNSDNYAYNAANDIVSFTLKTPDPNTFHVSFPSTVDVNGLIITVNEEIQ